MLYDAILLLSHNISIQAEDTQKTDKETHTHKRQHYNIAIKATQPSPYFEILSRYCELIYIYTTSFQGNRRNYIILFEFLHSREISAAPFSAKHSYLVLGEDCEVLFSPCLSVCLCVMPIFWYFIYLLLEEISI